MHCKDSSANPALCHLEAAAAILLEELEPSTSFNKAALMHLWLEEARSLF
jgi:hypothetical protein